MIITSFNPERSIESHVFLPNYLANTDVQLKVTLGGFLSLQIFLA